MDWNTRSRSRGLAGDGCGVFSVGLVGDQIEYAGFFTVLVVRACAYGLASSAHASQLLSDRSWLLMTRSALSSRTILKGEFRGQDAWLLGLLSGWIAGLSGLCA